MASLAAFGLLLTSVEAATCKASYYGGGRGERLARHTASGEVFNAYGLTAAHPNWRFGTRVKVTHGSWSVVVRINDRGPARWTGRCIDLSYGAARQLGMLKRGVASVKIQIVR